MRVPENCFRAFRVLRVSVLAPVVFSICCAAPAPSVSVPTIALHSSSGAAHPAVISITGLSQDDLARLRGARPNDEDWPTLLKITVDSSDADLPPVSGR